MFKETGGQLGEKTKIVVEIPDEDDAEDDLGKKEPTKSTRRERKLSGRRKSMEEKEASREERKKEKSPVKLLDDLFHKTKALPSIYWLPVSDDEVVIIYLLLLFCCSWDGLGALEMDIFLKIS